MSKIFTTKFRTAVVGRIITSNPIFYMFLGKSQPFIDDLNAPDPTDRVSETYTGAYDSMIAAKSIASTDMSPMIPRIDWQSGVGYKAYRHDSGSLYGNNFYVSVDSGSGHDVFKCLSNNGTLSTVAPDATSTSPSDDIYETSDGYQWKYMYTVPNAVFTKFASEDFIPVFANAAVVGNAVSGAIDYTQVTYGGSNYDAHTNGTIQATSVGGNSLLYVIESSASSNANFYNGSAIKITTGTGAGQQRTVAGYLVSGSTRTIVLDRPFDLSPTISSTYEITPNVLVIGNGNNFQARALVNSAASNSVYKIEITNRGSGYTTASLYFAGNTGGVSNAASAEAIIGPKGGHGSDPINELGGRYLCITTTFNTSDAEANNKVLDTSEFRSIGIISNPSMANIQLSYTSSTGSFINGETITQATTNATGKVVTSTANTVTLTNVTRHFRTGNSSVNYIVGANSGISAEVVAVRNNNSANLTANVSYACQLTKLNISSLSGSFVSNETVTMTGNTATSNAIVYFANTSQVWLTHVKGAVGTDVMSPTTGSTAPIDSVVYPDIIYGSGDIMYMENFSPINKAQGQTESIKAIIEF
jgi:hypothetical protein